ncbi:NAD(P)H-binding protein [Spirillospora sp. NBC_00431]
MTILVTGATGNVGRRVVEELIKAGRPVRALTRNPSAATLPPEVRVVEGDLADPGTLRPAFEDVDRLFLFPVPETAEEVAALARRAGIEHVVVLSSAAVTAGYDTEFHLPVERAVERANLAYTHVRPGEFALNRLYLWGPGIRSEGRVVDPLPDVADIPTHEWDIADVATAALLEDGHAGKSYTFAGPAELTHREQVAAISAAIGREIRIDACTPEEAGEYYRRQGGWAAANADYLVGLADYSGTEAAPDWEETEAPELATAQEFTGRPGRTFAAWAHDHRDDFR